MDEQQVATLMEGVTDARDAAIVGLLLHSAFLSELCSLDRDSIRVEKLDGDKVIGIGRVISKGKRSATFWLI